MNQCQWSLHSIPDPRPWQAAMNSQAAGWQMQTSISKSQVSPIISTHCFLLMQMRNSGLAHCSAYPGMALCSMCDTKALNLFCHCRFGWRRSCLPAGRNHPLPAFTIAGVSICHLNEHSLQLFLLLCSWGLGLLSLQILCKDPFHLFLIFPDAAWPAHLLPQLLY